MGRFLMVTTCLFKKADLRRMAAYFCDSRSMRQLNKESPPDVQISDFCRFGADPRVSRDHLRKTPEKLQGSKLLNVAIIGSTNAGKSVLTNALVGAPVSGVSSKCHTTRRVTHGISVVDCSQLVFQDTPGFLTDNIKNVDVEKSMLTDAENSLSTAQLIVVLHDVSNKFTCKRLDSRLQFLLYRHRHVPSVLALNKVDLLKNKSILLEIINNLTCGRVNGQILNKKLTPAVMRAENHEKSGKSSKLDQIMNDYKKLRFADDKLKSEIFKPFVTEWERKAEIDSPTDLNEEIEADRSKIFDEVTVGNELDQQDTLLEDENLMKKVEDSGPTLIKQNRPNFDRRLWPNVDWSTLDKVQNTSMHVIPRSQLKKCFMDEKGWPGFCAVFSMSALFSTGVGHLKKFLLTKAQEAPWRYHSSVVSPLSTIQLVKEIVRATVMEHVAYNLPYTLKYQILSWEVNEHDTLCILMNLICDHERSIKFIAGKELYKLKLISAESSQKLSDLFGRDVFIKFNVVPLKLRK